MAKNNNIKKKYNDTIKKQPPKVINASNIMNIITIVCAIIFVTLLVLKWTEIFVAPPLLLWSPVIVFGICFVITVGWMMKVMITEGLVSPTSKNKPTSNNTSSVTSNNNSIKNRQNMTHGNSSHRATKKKRKKKKK